ncbi:energy-coupling factor transporter ATPase [[Clostridium] innocuum]|nr:energy-coupling factor transporter ATPase [[Clostridium] innocuum]
MPITFQRVTHTYHADSPFSYAALKGIDLEIPLGKVTAIIGETGSGKSTLVQHLNALLLPTEGELHILDKTITAGSKPKHLKELRRQVGLVFQFPEYQLFEETIEKDISFGPKNFGVSAEAAAQRAREVLQVVGLDDSYLQRSPFDLSGGQKRRIAIAGILAMDPDVLVLDEPTAGLDPQGARDMMQLFVDMNKKYGKTVLIVTHDMEHVLQYCEEVVVVQDGRIKKHCDVQSFFETVELLKELNINPPAVIRLREELRKRGFEIERTILDMEKLAAAVAGEVKRDE